MAFNLNEDQKKVLAFSQNVINEVKKVVIGKDEMEDIFLSKISPGLVKLHLRLPFQRHFLLIIKECSLRLMFSLQM